MSYSTNCSFCDKDYRKTQKLVVGHAVSICRECIVLCCDLAEFETLATRLLALVEDIEPMLIEAVRPAPAAQAYDARVEQLGREIGFGAMMVSASIGWRKFLLEAGYPAGGEFTLGPCRATAEELLAKLREITREEATDAR